MSVLAASSTKQLPSTASPVKKWLHHHPSVQKTALIALMVFGFLNIYEGGRNLSLSRVTLGALVLGGAIMSVNMLPLYIPPTHPIKEYAFQRSSCLGVTLDYYGDLPVLKIPKEVSPYNAGYARGFMMAKEIRELTEANRLAFSTVGGLPNKTPFLVEKIKKWIPDEYLKEMQGVVEGYNAQRKKWKLFAGDPLTLEDVIYVHLLPDTSHLDLKQQDNYARRNESVMGCTTVIDGSVNEGPKAIRTVDWLPMDVYGTYAYIELRETEAGVRTINQSFPGFVGFLTAMNESGLSAAINVARGLTDYPEGIPTVFFLRKMVESCSAICGDSSAEDFWQKHRPLGPFNLTILDENEGCSVHFYQGNEGKDLVRKWAPDKELITLNFRYGEKGATNATVTNSEERLQEIEKYYNNLRNAGRYNSMSPLSRLKPILKGPEVNNIRTTTTAYLDPKNRCMLSGADNGYAGDRPLMATPSIRWLKREK